ncbi:unnamed protein product, partial [Adineta steineri]
QEKIYEDKTNVNDSKHILPTSTTPVIHKDIKSSSNSFTNNIPTSSMQSDIVNTLINPKLTNLNADHDLINSINEPSYSTYEQTNIMNNIFNPPTSTSSSYFINTDRFIATESDYGNLYQDHYFPTNTIQDTLLDFISIDDESLSEKQDLPDLNKIYYELKEQRYVATLTNDTDKQQTENDDNES